MGAPHPPRPRRPTSTEGPVGRPRWTLALPAVAAWLDAAAAVVVAALAIAPAAAGASPVTAEALHLGSSTLVVGRSGTLEGTGWPPGSSLQAAICGALADAGSADCANTSAVTVAPGPDGAVSATFPVVVPPTPCPCVVLVQGNGVDYLERFPVEVVGAPGGTPVPVRSAPPRPAIVVVPATARVGTSVGVTGTGFAADEPLELVVCGDLGLGGTEDCAAHAGHAVATGGGDVHLHLAVEAPPVPCPCVVEALASGHGAVLTPVTVLGAPAGEPKPAPPVFADVRVLGASLRGSGPWESDFGASPRRTLELVLADRGGAPTGPLSLRLGVTGDGGRPRSLPVTGVGALAPGQTRTIRVPVRLPAMTFGTSTLRGTVGSAGQSVPFAVATGVVPWGLVAVAALVALAVLVAATLGARRRRSLTPRSGGITLPAALAATQPADGGAD